METFNDVIMSEKPTLVDFFATRSQPRRVMRSVLEEVKRIVITKTIVLGLGVVALSSCYSVMPINDAKTAKENKSAVKTVIVYYDPAIGTDAIDTFIKKNHIEVLYRYSNVKGYALKLQSDKQRTALEKTKGVLSVQDDQVIQL